jgi:tRNA(adenine34) deaminase
MVDDEFFMREALKEAQKAYEEDEVPVGAVIIYENKIIARAHNQVRKLKDPTAHAEMIAITQAGNYLGYERLNGCRIYVTIEPCIMCAGAIILSRIDKLIYGAGDNNWGAFGSIFDVRTVLPVSFDIKSGILEQECKDLIQNFFKHKRFSGV